MLQESLIVIFNYSVGVYKKDFLNIGKKNFAIKIPSCFNSENVDVEVVNFQGQVGCGFEQTDLVNQVHARGAGLDDL